MAQISPKLVAKTTPFGYAHTCLTYVASLADYNAKTDLLGDISPSTTNSVFPEPGL